MEHRTPSNRGRNLRGLLYANTIFTFILFICVLWLFVDIGRINLSAIGLPLYTLEFRVTTNENKITASSQNISVLSTNDDILAANLSSIYTDIGAVEAELAAVGAIARNADFYSHSHGFSDERLKTEISDVEDITVELLGLRAVKFFWDVEAYPFLENMPTNPQYGLIAQEVETVFPELVFIGRDGYLQIDYQQLTPILLRGFQEQYSEIQALKQTNANLENRIEALEEMILNR